MFQGLIHEIKNLKILYFVEGPGAVNKKMLLYRSCREGEITFFFCHVISHDPIIKETRDLVNLNPTP